jgi:hypothetical protein
MGILRTIAFFLGIIGAGLFIFEIMDHGAYWNGYSIILWLVAAFLWTLAEPTKPPPPREPKLSESYKYSLIYDRKAKYWIMTVKDEPSCITIGESPEEALGRMKMIITRYDCIEKE